MIYDRAKFECGKWRATFTATTYAEAATASLLLGGVPLTVACHFLCCRFSGSYMWTQMNALGNNVQKTCYSQNHSAKCT